MLRHILKTVLAVQLVFSISAFADAVSSDYSTLTFYQVGEDGLLPDQAYQPLGPSGKEVYAIVLEEKKYQQEFRFKNREGESGLYAPDVIVLDDKLHPLKTIRTSDDVDACSDKVDTQEVLDSNARYLVLVPDSNKNKMKTNTCFLWQVIIFMVPPLPYTGRVSLTDHVDYVPELSLFKSWNERTRVYWATELESNGFGFWNEADNYHPKTPTSLNFHLGLDIPWSPRAFARLMIGSRFTPVNDYQHKGQMIYLGAGYRPAFNWNVSAGLRADFNRSHLYLDKDYVGNSVTNYETSYGLRLATGYHLSRSWSGELSATFLDLTTTTGVVSPANTVSLSFFYHFN